MKVSLSASHNNCQAAKELLETCDLIYTTQWKSLDEISLEFPDAIVRPIPDCGPDIMEFLQQRHEHDEVIGFGDLMSLRNKECK